MLALIMPAVAFSQTVNLQTAGNFGILAGGAITGASVVTGNVGTTAGAIAGVTVAAGGYQIYPMNDPIVQTAQTHLAAAYLDASTRGGATSLSLGAYDLSTTGTFTPGVYRIGGAATMSTTVTLNGAGVYIFQITGSLTTAASISLTNGAVWTDIFWQVGDFAALAAGFNFDGNVMANNYITVGAGGAIVNGRLLAKTNYVTAAGATVGGSEIPLPVELVSFTATANRLPAGGRFNADLHWSTATEVNNYGFDVERRLINSQSSTVISWTKIGFVEGSGTSNSTHSYSYTDASVSSGTYAYRLKQIDNNGTYKYSSEAEITIAVPKFIALNQNYPNPFNPTTTITFTLAQDGFTTLKIYDVLGREVTTLVNGEMKSGVMNAVSFNASKLSSGVYFSRLESSGNVQTKTLMLLK
jgi:hypothetical protein